jgi:hypothetical protein
MGGAIARNLDRIFAGEAGIAVPFAITVPEK